MIAGKPEVMREVNKSLILETIRKQGPVSRANLNKMLNLSFPAVSSIVTVLLEEGWILETKKDSNLVGRKATLLEYNGNKGYVIGVDIGRAHLSVLLADVAGRIRSEAYSRRRWRKGEELIEELLHMLHGLLNKDPEAKGGLMCISVGIPGIYQKAEHKNVLVPFLDDWENIDIAEILEREFGVPALLDNSVNLGAIGEKWRGKGRNYSHILYLDFGIGIGSALILNGELYRGMNGAAGEIGYSLPDYELAQNRFSVEGLFEKLASGHAAIENRASEEFLESVKNYTSVILVNCVALLNPEIIIFSGNFGVVLLNKFQREFTDILQRHIPFVPRLEVSELGEKANVTGALGVALRNVHSGFNISGK